MGRDKSDRPGELARRASRVLSIEAEAIMDLRERLDENFFRAIDILLRAPGEVILAGGGESGRIGRENAPALASTAIPCSRAPAPGSVALPAPPRRL